MRLARIASGVIVTILLAVATPGRGDSQEVAAPGYRVGVVDIAGIRRNASVSRSINAQVQRHVAVYQTDIENEEAQLRTAQADLDRRRPQLSQESYVEELRAWEEEVAEAQRKFLQRRQKMERARADAWQKVNQAIDQIISTLATERRYDVILRREQTMFVDPRLEITEEVLRRLDASMPYVPLDVPQG